MATFDLSLIEAVNLDTAKTYELPFTSGHSVGDIVKPDGTISGAVGDVLLGVVLRAGSAAGNKTLVLVEGEVECASAHGLAANAIIYSDGDNTASDAEPGGGAGTRVTELGYAISTTRAYIKLTSYELGA